MSVVLQTGVMYYRESQSDDWHPLILKVDTDLSTLIEDYSQKAWALGEYCRYDSAVYRCTTAITIPEVWDSTHWQETTIGEELKNITDITGDGDLDSGFTASDLTGAANELKDITGDGSLTGFTATDLTGAANELKNTLNSVEMDVGYLKSDIGIVEDTDTAQHTITAGQYVIWKGQLYTASTAIPAGTTLSGTNLTAVGSGGLNNLMATKRGFKIVRNYLSTTGTTIAAHSGVGKNISVTVPTGYKFVGHLSVWATGTIGVIGGFDGLADNPTVVTTFINNTRNDSVTLGDANYVHCLTLFEPDGW